MSRRRSRQALALAAPIPMREEEKPRVEPRIGYSGTPESLGRIDVEYHADLKELEKRVARYNEARTGNAAIVAALEKLWWPIARGTWNMDASERGNARADDAAEIMRANILRAGAPGSESYRMITPWSQFLWESFTAEQFGFSIHEKVERTQSGPLGTFHVYHHLAWIHPSSIWQFRRDRDGQLLGIVQRFQARWWEGEGKAATEKSDFFEDFIPAENLFVRTRKKEGSNDEGTALLRGMYADAKRNQAMLNWQAVHAQRVAVGVPRVKILDGAPPEVQARALDMAKLMRGGAQDRLYVVESPGIEVGWVKNDTGALDLSEILRAGEDRTRGVASLEWAGLGQAGAGGSRAVGDVQQRPFWLQVEGIAEGIAEDIQTKLVEPMHRKNFADVAPPRTRVADVSPIAIADIALAASSGLVVFTAQDSNDIRRTLKLRTLTPEEMEEQQALFAQRAKSAVKPPEKQPAPAEPEPDDSPEPEPAPAARDSASGDDALDEGKELGEREPSEAQRKAGNYKKRHVNVRGLEIAIETEAGKRRRPEWPPLRHAYGYIKGSVGRDKDHVDAFLGPLASRDGLPVFVIDQVRADGSFDEHKVMLGFETEGAARQAYLSNYAKGWKGLGACVRMSFEKFREWVFDHKATLRPAADGVELSAIELAAKPKREPRPPNEFEAKHCALDDIRNCFDALERDAEQALRAARDEAADEALASMTIRGTRVTVLKPKKAAKSVTAALRAIADKALEVGRATAKHEIQSQMRDALPKRSLAQRTAEALGLAERPEPFDPFAIMPPRKRGLRGSVQVSDAIAEELETVIRLNTESVLDAVVKGIKREMLSGLASEMVDEDAVEAARRAIKDYSTAPLEGIGREIASRGINGGRAEVAEEAMEGLAGSGKAINFATRTAVLDEGTCENCVDLDGTRVDVGSDEYFALMPPARCLGGAKCRCIYVFEIEDSEGGGPARVPEVRPPSPAPDGGSLTDDETRVVRRWTGDNRQITDRAESGDRNAQAELDVLADLASRPAAKRAPIYRGMGLREDVAADLLPGATFDSRAVSSWTLDQSVADGFAWGHSQDGGRIPVRFVVRSPRYGTDVSSVSPGVTYQGRQIGGEQEFLTGGRLRIVSVGKGVINGKAGLVVEAEHE